MAFFILFISVEFIKSMGISRIDSGTNFIYICIVNFSVTLSALPLYVFKLFDVRVKGK